MLLGHKIGPFAIDKELGSGAMGTVYRATNTETGQRVALKVMAPGVGSSETALARFKREAAILKQLEHPNIVRILASGRFSGNPFYAMEYVEGESLDKVLARRGRITWEEVVALGTQLCEGLQHAHQKGIVHRDLKPSNLMILADGTVKLMDFGIAKDLDVTGLTAANCTVGTASYMSPEQCRGESNLTHKSDLYSLGVMFYELLTGKKPFVADSVMDMFVQHTTGTFERPSRRCLDIPIWLDTLVCQLLEKKPDQRPFDANAVEQALSRIKEKVEAQHSAGMEAATARKIDRSALQPALDETDKEAARTLLHKKKRAKAIPFYQQGWFQSAAFSALALVMGFLVYWLFFKAPSADALLEEMDRLAKSENLKDWERAVAGPMRDFLRRFPDHPQAAQVRQKRDDLECRACEIPMHNRRRAKLPAEAGGEQQARDALEDEDSGRLDKAKLTWEKLAAYTSKADTDPERAWGLVAKKYLGFSAQTDQLVKELQKRLENEKDKKPAKPPAPPTMENLVLDALRAEATNPAEAQDMWRKAKNKLESEIAQRPYYLLATERLRLLRAAPKKDGK